MTIVKLSNKEIIGRVLDKLAEGISPFVEQQLKRKNFPYKRTKDPYMLLTAMTSNWHEVFRSVLGKREQSWAHELLAYRNLTAHNELASDKDVERALDTACMLLEAVGANETELEVREMLQILRPQDSDAQTQSKRSATRSDATELGAFYSGFWRDVLKRIRAEGLSDTRQKPTKRGYVCFSSGRSDFLYCIVFGHNNTFRVQLYINSDLKSANKKYFNALENQKDAIEKEMQAKLSWKKLEDKGACRIAIFSRPFTDRRAERERLIEWCIRTYARMKEVFGPRIRELARRGR